MESNRTEIPTRILEQLSDELAAAVERAAATIVTVNARRRMPASGIAWISGGTIVTANHVVERDDDITVLLPGGQQVSAMLTGRDPGSDLAVLQAEAGDLGQAPRSASAPRPGQLVLAAARPGHGSPMASLGIVSQVGGAWRPQEGASIDGFVRSDAAMLPGFSGGPLVDTSGDVIGLNSSTLGRRGGITIPAATIDRVVDLIRNHGQVRRGFLGVSAQPAAINTRLGESLGLDQERALVVIGIEQGGPAETHGMLLGDVITAIDGAPVMSVEGLQERLSGDAAGKPITVTVIRAGALAHLSIVTGVRA